MTRVPVAHGPALDCPVSRRALIGAALAAGLVSRAPRAWAAGAALDPALAADWPQVAALLRSYVDVRKLPGAVTTLGWGKDSPRTLALGAPAFDSSAPIGIDSLFRIYSMTKPVTGLLAALMIVRGRLSLDTPVGDICPELRQINVAIDPAKGLDARPAASAITIRHLLTHTAGFGYAVVQRDKVSHELLRRGLVTGQISRKAIPGVTPGIPAPPRDQFLKELAKVPLIAEPGSRWRYSMSIDVLGMVLERLTGQGLPALMRQQIFDPIGMPNTGFRVSDAALRRLTTNYAALGGTTLPLDTPDQSVFRDIPQIAYGGAGLVSSPRDFDRFMQVLLSDGRVGGRRVLREDAVRLAVSNLLPPGAATTGTSIAGAGFGAGGRVGLGADEGSFGWSGAAGTLFLVQRRIGMRAGLYAQFMPSEAYPLQKDFLAAVLKDSTARRADSAGVPKP